MCRRSARPLADFRLLSALRPAMHAPKDSGDGVMAITTSDEGFMKQMSSYPVRPFFVD
jgi:hypothetical protein